ncbi:MAG: hypothetical protein EOP05_10735 [Proteobacteria bacterium]|nr:MAG: hypothetical protein EOP05_10735 [Pseudomonadota bacterium]
MKQPQIRPQIRNEVRGTFFSFRNIAIAAGLAFLAPYVVRRVLPLLQGDAAMDSSPRDFKIAGKDAVRDAADDLGVGGIKGTFKRGIDRVADRLN